MINSNKKTPLFSTHLMRGGILITGPDAQNFLQGLITQDIQLLEHSPALYTAHLTAQGKFLHDFFIYPTKEGYILETEPGARRDDLIMRFNRYKLRSHIDISPIILDVIVGNGRLPIIPHSSEKTILVADPRHQDLGWRLVLIQNQSLPPDLSISLDTTANRYDQHRILLGIPDGSRDAEIGVSTAEELNLTRLNAISFTKGCYIGQELTARIEHRGLSKRHLYPVHLTEPHSLKIETQDHIYRKDILVGHIRSRNEGLAMALLRDDVLIISPGSAEGHPIIQLKPIKTGWQLILQD